MLGISYGELFLLLGATAALIGPKELPIISRAAGRLAGRAVGYVQLARGQFENVMQQSQVSQVHKELQDAMAQLDAIRYDIRRLSVLNPGPFTQRLVDNLENASSSSGNTVPEKLNTEISSTPTILKDCHSATSDVSNIYSQATAYAKLAESTSIKDGSSKLIDASGSFSILPVSAETAGLLTVNKENAKGSDIVLEAILEAEVAHNAKDFFSRPENQIKGEETGSRGSVNTSKVTQPEEKDHF